MILDDLPTPCLLVDRSRLDRNLDRMQARADQNGVGLRPHVKTHKAPALARRQLERGARGITVAKPAEAAVFADAGFTDIRVAYCVVGPEKHARLLGLMDRARISFCVDTPEGARAASAFYGDRGRTVDVLLEIDTGHGRCGVPWDRHTLGGFARFVSELPGLRLTGLLTHAGHAYHGPATPGETPAGALLRTAEEERDRILSVAERLGEVGLPGLAPGRMEISIGSTPSMSRFENRTHAGYRITEIRPGNYVFNDAMQVGLTSAAWTDCALTVLATVVSKHRDATGEDRLYLDAGKKVLTSDTGYGTNGYGMLLYSSHQMIPLPHAEIVGLSEEHGWVRVHGGSTLNVGDRVRIVPNHACVTVNLQPELYVVNGEDVVETWAVEARGAVQ